MTATEALEKRISEYANHINELEKEIKKLRDMNDGLVKTQIKILQNAILGDQETVAINEETIKNGQKMIEVSKTVEKSAEEAAKLAFQTTGIIDKVTLNAQAVGQVAGKVYEQADNATQGTTKVLQMGKQAANVSNQMAIGMQQVSTAAQQISTGAQKLAELSQNAAKSTEALRKVMDEAGQIAKDTSTTTKEALKKSKDANVKSQEGLKVLDNIKTNMTKVTDAVSSMVTQIDEVGQMANSVSDIAGQTNMLALNAAIEAARAGEAGRGFISNSRADGFRSRNGQHRKRSFIRCRIR